MNYLVTVQAYAWLALATPCASPIPWADKGLEQWEHDEVGITRLSACAGPHTFARVLSLDNTTSLILSHLPLLLNC